MFIVFHRTNSDELKMVCSKFKTFWTLMDNWKKFYFWTLVRCEISKFCNSNLMISWKLQIWCIFQMRSKFDLETIKSWDLVRLKALWSYFPTINIRSFFGALCELNFWIKNELKMKKIKFLLKFNAKIASEKSSKKDPDVIFWIDRV